MKKHYPKTPDETVKLCSGFHPFTNNAGDYGVWNADLKKFIIIRSKAEIERIKREHEERQEKGILRTEWKPGEPELTEEEIAVKEVARKAPPAQKHVATNLNEEWDSSVWAEIGRPPTREEKIDSIARAELIDEDPDYEAGCCLDSQGVGRRKGAISNWLNADRDKEPFREIYAEEIQREEKKKDPLYDPLTRAIDRFRKEHKRSISKKTARRYLKNNESRPYRQGL